MISCMCNIFSIELLTSKSLEFILITNCMYIEYTTVYITKYITPKFIINIL